MTDQSIITASPPPQSDTETDFDLQDQDLLDKSVSRDLEGVGSYIAGIPIRTLSLSRTMRLHEVKNEIMAGLKVSSMKNPIFSAMEFLYIMDARNDPKEIAKQVFGDSAAWRESVSLWGEEIPMSETIITDVIEFINDSTSTRVKARPPESLKKTLEDAEGNG